MARNELALVDGTAAGATKKWAEQALNEVKHSADPSVHRQMALWALGSSADFRAFTSNVDKLLERQRALLEPVSLHAVAWYVDLAAGSAFGTFDVGLAYLTAMSRIRLRDAEVAAYVERVRTADVEPDPDPGELRRRCDDARLSRLPDSVDRALPRETRAGPASDASQSPDCDESSHDALRLS